MSTPTAANSNRASRGKAAFLVAAIALLALTPDALRAQSATEWHGYGQFRYTRASTSTGFMVRRAKLWMQGSVPGVHDLSFKVQGVFRNAAAGSFVLQDFFAEYRGAFGRIRLGQMVPAFSLQRSQPDFRVPLVERAGVVDALIPGAKSLARDIGAQLFLGSGAGPVHVSAGIFNGAGADHAAGREGSYLATTRLTVTHGLSSGVTGTVGVSGAWRRTSGTDVGIVSTAGNAFSGEDRRWGVEAHVLGGGWEVQGEYLEGRLEADRTRGFYVLGDCAISQADQLVLSLERLQTPVSGDDEDPWYIVGFNRSFSVPGTGTAGHARIPEESNGGPPDRLMADVRFRHSEAGTEYGAEVQLQFFVH